MEPSPIPLALFVFFSEKENDRVQLTAYHVDAFTDSPFRGNPAAVYVLREAIPDALMQKIAAEHNLSETAFCLPTDSPEDADYSLRWFTPTDEVDLCGHATLATAYVLYEHEGFSGHEVRFQSRSGVLRALSVEQGYTLDLPVWTPMQEPVAEDLARQLGITVQEQYRSTDVLLVTDDASAVSAATPPTEALLAYGARCVILSAPGNDGADFVSRVFCPAVGVPEDPVTGSAHCLLTPYWSERLGRNELHAQQLSRRGGDIHCVLSGDRVLITGNACLFYKGVVDLSRYPGI